MACNGGSEYVVVLEIRPMNDDPLLPHIGHLLHRVSSRMDVQEKISELFHQGYVVTAVEEERR